MAIQVNSYENCTIIKISYSKIKQLGRVGKLWHSGCLKFYPGKDWSVKVILHRALVGMRNVLYCYVKASGAQFKNRNYGEIICFTILLTSSESEVIFIHPCYMQVSLAPLSSFEHFNSFLTAFSRFGRPVEVINWVKRFETDNLYTFVHI